MKSWRISDQALSCAAVQRLPGPAFKAAFFAALSGKESAFSPFIAPGRDRPSGPAWAKLRAAVFARDDYTCRYCGERGGRLECDHVDPIARGGASVLDNLATACRDCNRSKRDKPLTLWQPPKPRKV